MMTRTGHSATGPLLIHSQFTESTSMANDVAPDRDRMARQWAMLLHLSVFAGYIAVGLGFIAPILIWQFKKVDYPELDQHGKNVANWLISAIIYAAVFTLLLAVFVGFILLVILGVLGVIFPIIGAIKASNGEVWKYPLSITFIK
jgi:uncharacterized protein